MTEPKDVGPYHERASQRAIHRAVQNVMFNELKITKDGIESQLKKEILAVSNNRINAENVQTWILNAISKAVYGRYGGDNLAKIIEAEVKNAIAEHVKKIVDEKLRDNLSITITTPVEKIIDYSDKAQF